MNRVIQILNLAGVLILSAVCVLQWERIGAVAAVARRYAAESADRAATITARDRTISQDAADLDDLRQRLMVAGDRLRGVQADRDAARSAIKVRDDLLEKQAAAVDKIAADRNATVAKFNDLATRYNTLVKQAGQK